MTYRLRCAWVATVACASAAVPAGGVETRAALAGRGLPDLDAALLDALAVELEQAGYTVVELDGETLCDAAQLTPQRFDLLVLPNAAALPARSTRPISRFLQAGGNLIALNAPLWQKLLVKQDGRWLTRRQYLRDTAGRLPTNVLVDFTPDNLARWQRSSNHADRAASHETVPAGPGTAQRALHVVVSDLDGWDTYGSPSFAHPFPEGHVLTIFTARGGPRTRMLSFEWKEKDGSRWIAVVPLSPTWRRYVLAPKDFHYWSGNPARGKSGDQFRPQNAAVMHVGLAFSHTEPIGGRHEYWLGPVGTDKSTPEYQDLVNVYKPPPLETLGPEYKFFDSQEVAELQTPPDQVIIKPARFPVPPHVRSSYARPGGAGFDKGRNWRWGPLAEARSAGHQWRGTPATLMLHADGEFKGGIWASFAVGDRRWYREPVVCRTIGQIAHRMKQGVFILDGGADHYTYFEDQPVRLGLRVINLGRDAQKDLAARVTLVNRDNGKIVRQKDWPLDLDPAESISLGEIWTPARWPAAGFLCTAELFAANLPIDRVVHQVYVWRPRPEKEFITVKDGDFMLQGQPWRAHGVNYMPSSGLAAEDRHYFERWLGARSYDPQVIERDLRHIKDIGFNSLSVFIYHDSIGAGNLLDLLRRMENHDLKANLSLRPGTPMNFLWPQMREIIEHYRLAENDTVFAYDLAWEPHFGPHENRKQWDRQWEAWITERYGSIANAERDWGFAAPRDDAGNITNPLRPQIEQHGDWHRMVAAYRRFLDTLLYWKYSRARRLVRTVDPHHLVSFRMTEAGNPTLRWNGILPYDFPYLAAAVDILEPEAYGRIGDWQSVKPGWFTFEYARWAAPGLPMIWSEMGVSAWDRGRMQTTPDLLEFQASFYRDFYRMMISSAADGVFFWWYPGGYRYNEKSDYGIINPDGTDRPVTRVIREMGPRFLAGPRARAVDYWIEIDRDAHANGLTGIFAAAKDEFFNAINAGRVPGLKTAGTGTDSADCPLVAVGNTPCDGTNPPKYLDAAFDLVEVQSADGKWVAVEKGGRVQVRADRPTLARLTLTNLGEAKWRAPNGTSKDRPAEGAVYVITRGPHPTRTPIPRPVPHLSSIRLDHVKLTTAAPEKPAEVAVTLLAEHRTSFGETFTVILAPRPVTPDATDRPAG